MSRSQSHIFDGTSTAVFDKQKNLGAYAKVSFFRAKGSIHVIYDREATWIIKYVKKITGTVPETLTIEQIHQILGALKGALRIQRWKIALGMAPKFDAVREHYYYDDMDSLCHETDITLVLAAKQLFENYTRLETRIVALEGASKDAPRWVLVIKAKDPKSLSNLVFDVTQGMPDSPLDGFESGLLLRQFRLLESCVMVTPPQGEWTAQKKSLSVFGDNGQELHFQVTGRTPAERRFEKDEEAIAKAEGSQLVPLEINFHPFWRPLGHTTLRIGRALYELSATGWKAHNHGSNIARAFIFNNPFFRKQLSLFADQGMPPMSLGVTLMVPKEKVDVLQIILQNLVAAQGPHKEKFSLLKNNCNQGIVRVLTQAGIEGFDHKGYLEFSTVLTYRELLLNPPYTVEGLRVYPLPNTTFDEAKIRSWIPVLLYRNNNVSLEVRRALPVFPRDFIFINWKRLLDFVRRDGGRNVADI